MNILYICEFDLSVKRGASIHVLELINNLKKLDHKIFLLIPRFNKKRIDIDTNIYRTPILKLGKLLIPLLSFQIFSFPRLLNLRNKIDIVCHRISGVSSIIGLYCRILRIPYICEVNGLIQDELEIAHSPKIIKLLSKTFESFTYKMAKKIIAVTPGIKRELHKMFRIPPDKIEVVPNGANVNLFRPIKNAKQKLGLDPNYKYVGFVGNLTRWQGVEYLIQAAPEIIKKESRIRFLIVGDGIMRSKLEEMIRKLELENYFIFTGNVEYKKVPLYINSFNVCVAPWIKARNEKIGLSPLKLYEYLACEKPVVASNVEGVGNFLQKYNIGITVQPDQPKELTSAILKFLQDKNLAEETGKRGKEIVVKKYSWQSTAKKIEKVHNKVLSN